MKRFDHSKPGEYADEKTLVAMTDKELEAAINALDFWDADQIRELAWRADIDLGDEDHKDKDIGDIAAEAAEILGLNI